MTTTATRSTAPTGRRGSGRLAAGARTLLRAPFEAATWRAVVHLLVGAVLGFVGLVVFFVVGAFGVVSSITLLGLPLIALTVLAARRVGAVHRALGRRLIGAQVADPEPFRPEPGLFGWLRSALRDAVGWRAMLYVYVKFPVAVIGGYLALIAWVVGGVMASYPVWWQPADPSTVDDAGVRHHSGMEFGGLYIDSWPRAPAVSAVGLLVLLLAPWPVRGLAALDRLLVGGLLGPPPAARVRELERSRALAVQDAAATLRRLERDLHDGTQARLVTVAMNVGLARTRLEEGGAGAELDEALRLLDNAHRTAKDAITELRDLVQGIHPPVLDTGLEHALATLAARSVVPVTLRTAVDAPPAPEVEAIAYFSAAELLTNTARHSGASAVTVDLDVAAGRLTLRVGDDGRGGARLDAGTGLPGLASRVAAVDGRLVVDSPPGGPTVVTVTLPVRT